MDDQEIVIIDAGATKTRWIYMYEEDQEFYKTKGLNVSKIKSWKIPPEIPEDIDKVFFYGTGSVANVAMVIYKKLTKRFNTTAIHVGSDSEAVALACCGNTNGYIHIMGTGSSLNYWDGQTLQYPTTNLGYLFEDFASGYDMGSTIIKTWKQGGFNPKDEQLLHDQFGNLQDLVTNIYQSPNHKREVADISKMLPRLSREMGDKIIGQRLDSYFNNVKDHLVKGSIHHFSGSLASVMHKQIREKAKQYNFNVGRIMKDPINGLVGYFRQNFYGE